MHVFHIEPCQVQRVSHLSLAVGPFLANNRRGKSRFLFAVGVQLHLFHFSGEVGRRLELKGLLLVVVEPFPGMLFATLLAVEQVGGTVPGVSQRVNIELLTELVFSDDQLALLDRPCHDGKSHAIIFEDFFNEAVMFHLDDHPRVLGEEDLDQVGMTNLVEV